MRGRCVRERVSVNSEPPRRDGDELVIMRGTYIMHRYNIALKKSRLKQDMNMPRGMCYSACATDVDQGEIMFAE